MELIPRRANRKVLFIQRYWQGKRALHVDALRMRQFSDQMVGPSGSGEKTLSLQQAPLVETLNSGISLAGLRG